MTTTQARKACCDWTASHGKRLMCGNFGPIPCGVVSVSSLILVEIITCDFTHMRNLDGRASWYRGLLTHLGGDMDSMEKYIHHGCDLIKTTV